MQIVPKAIGARSGRAPLYRQTRGGSPLTDRSSFMRMEHHDAAPVADVEVVGVLDLLESLGEHVHVMKLDIEGAEAEVLEAMLDADGFGRVGRLFVETHERLDQALAHRLDGVRSRLRRAGVANVDLGWV